MHSANAAQIKISLSKSLVDHQTSIKCCRGVVGVGVACCIGTASDNSRWSCSASAGPVLSIPAAQSVSRRTSPLAVHYG